MDLATILKLITTVLPVAVHAAQTIAEERGKPIEQIIPDVINHLTKGAPNAPELGPN